jgi:hypothetical protein
MSGHRSSSDGGNLTATNGGVSPNSGRSNDVGNDTAAFRLVEGGTRCSLGV